MARSQRTSAADADRRFMQLALRVARRMLGRTAPNPAVGAVIADEATGEVIARGWTQAGGRPHAEAHALVRAGAHARGQTMYVTLEPCSHHGRTPPCANAIVAAGMRRVVCAIEDPNPEISGRGLAVLAQRRRRRRPRPLRRGGALDGGRPHPAHDAGPALRAAEDRRLRRRPDRARRRRPALGHGAGGPPARAHPARAGRCHSGRPQDRCRRQPRAHLPPAGPGSALAAARHSRRQVSHAARRPDVRRRPSACR